tara:strand:- start:214 stop:534 length:321 start_codon:yes stop_codon:yes gene_type:complete
MKNKQGTHPNSQANLKPFKKGESGNPSGRKRSFDGIKAQVIAEGNNEVTKDVLVDSLLDDVFELDKYEEVSMGTRKDVVVAKLWDMAQQGDKWAIELIAKLDGFSS